MNSEESPLSHAPPRAGTRRLNDGGKRHGDASPWRARGLYLVTPDERDTGRLRERVAPLLAHAALLQYRNKRADDALRQAQARVLQDLCSASGVPLIVNDSPRLALEAGASGVHLGEDDPGIVEARALLGDDAVIGVSCYDSIAAARRAVAGGADYVAFGAFFPSSSKPGQRRRASAELLQDARSLGVPRVAIGGITPDNAATPIAAGADLVAVIAGVFDAADPVLAARRIAALFD